MIKYFTDDDGIFKEFSAIKIAGYRKPANFPFGGKFTETVFKNTRKWLGDVAAHISNERAMMLAHDITLRVDATSHVILTGKDSEEWYEQIADFIEAMIFAFKKPEIGLPCYLREVTGLILSNNDVSKEQKELLTEYLALYKETNNRWPLYSDFELIDAATLFPVNEKHSPKDITIMGNRPKGGGEGHLNGTYRKWLKVFPFDLGCFKHDRQYFTQRFSDFITKNEERRNRYLELTFRSTKTQSELINFLTDTTKEILRNVQNSDWVATADISEIKHRRQALVLHAHRIKQEKLLTKFTDGEQIYIKVLKEWLKNEKEFFKELATCLPNVAGRKKLQASGEAVELFPVMVVGKLHEYCNGKLFELESVDLYSILNTPNQWQISVPVKRGEITRMKILMYHINEYLSEKDVPIGHLDAICRIFGLERKDCLKRKKLHGDYHDRNEDYLKQIQMILASNAK